VLIFKYKISGVLYNDGHSIVFNCSLAAAYKSLLLFASKNNSDSSVQMQTPNIEKSMNDNNDSVQNNLQLRYGINPEAPQGRADTSGVDLDDSEISRKRGRRVASIDDCSRGLTADEGLTRNCGDRNQLLALGSGSQIAGLQGSEKAPLPIAQQDASVFLSRRDLASSESLNAVGQEINEQVLADTAASSLLSGSNQQPLEEQIQAIQSRSLPKFSGAGLSYSYQLETMHLRFGPTPMESDEANGVQEESGQSGGEGASHHSSAGSEHRIDGRPFDGELQLFAYNWQLYKDFHEASSAPNGLLAISILISSQSATNNKTTTTETKKTTTSEKFQSLVDQAGESLKYQGQFLHVAEFSLLELFPEHSLDQYVTYEGSLTWPGCQESVTWLLLNRPLYLSKQSVSCTFAAARCLLNILLIVHAFVPLLLSAIFHSHSRGPNRRIRPKSGLLEWVGPSCTFVRPFVAATQRPT